MASITMAKQAIKKLSQVCEDAGEGYVEDLEFLKLKDDMIIDCWHISQTADEKTEEEMMQGIEDAVYNIEAAERLHLKHVAHISRQNLAFLRFINRAKFNEAPTVPHELRPEGVADAMRDLLEDSAKSLDRIVKLARDGESDGEKEINKTDPPHRPVSNIRVLMSDTKSNLVIASESGDSDPEPQEKTKRRAPTSQKQEEDDEDSEPELEEKPKRKRRKMMRTQVQSVLTTARKSVRCQNALFLAVT